MVVSWLADRGRAIFLAVLTGIGLHLAASGIAGDSWETNPTGLRWDRDPSLSEYFPEGVGIELPPTFREKALPVGGVPSGLTPIEGAGDVSTSGGALEFTVVGDRVVLGWGNVGGDLPVEQIESLWPVHNQVALRVRQSCESSTWHAELLADGDELDGEPRLASAVCRGRDWQEVLLESPRPWRPIHGRACPDGMTLTVDAPQGSRIEIESVKAIQPRYEGYVRKEFVLPEGRIWKAVANVGSANERIW
ncbi:MAG: hypothetical protein QGI83_21450, partial [Candidatus Latescibacteria bacterium]|nr:hypothetical protein [Candidatus Latescibacterota bacterium]